MISLYDPLDHTGLLSKIVYQKITFANLNKSLQIQFVQLKIFYRLKLQSYPFKSLIFFNICFELWLNFEHEKKTQNEECNVNQTE